jgi:Rad3-related DNA helicase
MQKYERLLQELRKLHEPRQPQLDSIRFISDNWESSRVLCINAPVGTGKSDVALAIQRTFEGTVIITPDNNLVNQYVSVAPTLNPLKGRGSYSCRNHEVGGSCGDSFAEFKVYCEGCPYVKARALAEMGADTVANPMSYFINIQNGVLTPAKTLVVDEAHTLAAFLRGMLVTKIPYNQHKWNPNDIVSVDSVITFLIGVKSRLKNLANLKEKAGEPFHKESEMVTRISFTLWAMQMDSSPWFFYVEPKTTREPAQLVIESMKVPQGILDVFMKSEKIVLMSGTLFPHHITDLVGKASYKYLSLGSIIPPASRTVIVRPCADTVNKDTPAETYAAKIMEIVNENKGKQGIIHASYGLADKLRALLERPESSIRGHGKDSKTEVLGQFKRKEFQWLIASGMAEGVDLAGDLGEINVICKLMYPYLGDPYIKKRMSMPDGQLWYSATTLQYILQACGRTTRGPNDFSKVFVLDGSLRRCLEKIKQLAGSKANQYIPAYFEESLYYV